MNLSTHITNTFEVDGLSQYGEPSANVLRNLNIVKRFVMKINNSLALYTLEMLVSFKLTIESLHIACTLDNQSCPDFG